LVGRDAISGSDYISRSAFETGGKRRNFCGKDVQNWTRHVDDGNI
jgi:hypothetical protein